ncbi:hypothetical protein DO021_19535 [Desulfobacter hydrogenophilus]|uniref:Uncharacterized protein n=1 Tax=Desulfobacter hydrogenophilus TaxID=2291 RepID=A0A328FB40_9BACT|nr:hypothetical protein [Desulfobacter hydrogenophilus]NDY73961.1 hypothetical protein [Desulfobacter hydrogenophilus]QBH14309.1 hypothetical protein EYB58_16130 [Desulfobacter hydrogenophilus]RAM00313.1 hypothetical protein DO021_19535 [Desulfobacter hydrogenophilus]
MKDEIKKQAQDICGSSVADGVVSMYHVKDIPLAKACWEYERHHMNRTSMLKVIKRRIKQLGGN